jgi:hypothetical protein
VAEPHLDLANRAPQTRQAQSVMLLLCLGKGGDKEQ